MVVSLSQKQVVRKVAAMEDRLVWQMLGKQYYYKNVFSKWVDLAYDNI